MIEVTLEPSAQIGVAYPHRLETACGVRHTHFSGSDRDADPALGDPLAGAPSRWLTKMAR